MRILILILVLASVGCEGQNKVKFVPGAIISYTCNFNFINDTATQFNTNFTFEDLQPKGKPDDPLIPLLSAQR